MASSPVGLPPGFQIVGQAQGQPQGPQQAPGLPPGFQVVGRAPRPQAPQANESPDNLPDLPSVQAGKQPQGAWEGFVNELGDAAKGALKFASDAVSGLGGNPAGAVSAMTDAAQGNVNELNRAGQEFKQGNYVQGLAHGAAGLLPGVGPAAVQAGENLGAGLGGDKERLGRGVADAAMLAAPEAIKESGAIPKATGALRAITKEDPRVLAAKAWTPTPQQTKFLDHIEDTGAVVKNYGNGGVSPKSNEEAIAAIDRAKKPFKAAIQKWVDAGTARGATIDGREIVKATRKAMNASDIREDPDGSQAFIDAIEDAYGHPIPVAEAYRLLQDKNANLTSHFNKREGAQISANRAGGNEGIVKAQRDAIQKSLYQALDPQNKGAGPKQIQRTLHDLIDFKNTALARKNQAIASRPASVSDAIKGAIPKAAQALHSPGMGYIKSADLAHPSTLLKGTVDPVVQRFFDSVDHTKASKIPLPPAPIPPRGLLNSPSPRLGPQMTPSGSHVHMGQIVTPQGPGPYPGRGMGNSTGARLLPPASQVQQPGFSVLGNQSAVTSPVTSKLDYVPEHYAPGQIPASETLGKGREYVNGSKLTPEQESAFQALRGGRGEHRKKK